MDRFLRHPPTIISHSVGADTALSDGIEVLQSERRRPPRRLLGFLLLSLHLLLGFLLLPLLLLLLVSVASSSGEALGRRMQTPKDGEELHHLFVSHRLVLFLPFSVCLCVAHIASVLSCPFPLLHPH